MTFCLPNCWKCGRCWQAHLRTAQKPEQGDGEGKRDSLLDVFVLIMFKPDSKWLYIEWFRHIQTISNKYVQALHLFGRAFRRCPRVCVERDGEHVVNVAAVELARRKLSQAFKHQVSVEPIAVDQSGAGRWQLQPDQPVIQVTSWFFLHTMFNLQFLQQSDFFSSTLALTRSLSIFYASGTCKRGLTDSHHATAVSRNNQQHLKSRIVSWKKHTRQKVNKISAHVHSERTGVCTKVI